MKEMDEKMKERVAKWLESLEEDERAQAELLDAYFTFRCNLPGVDPGFGKPFEEPKTTQDIIDELRPMMLLKERVVVHYLRIHDYGMTTVADGTVKWAIWRFVDGTVLGW